MRQEQDGAMLNAPHAGTGRVRRGEVRRLLVNVCVLALLVVWSGTRVQAAADEIIDRVLAVASGEVITLSDVRAARELGRVSVDGASDPVRAVLSQLIDRALVLAEVNRFAPPEPSPETIDAAFEAVTARFATVDVFDATLARLGVDRPFVRDLLREDLRIRAYLDQRFTAETQGDQRTMVSDWIAGLRRRSDVIDLYATVPSSTSGPATR